MKVLFVSRANVGRSQVAEAFYNDLSKKHSSTSAGTETNENGMPLGILRGAKEIIACMKNEHGLDVTNKNVKLLQMRMLEDADIVIAMGDGEEIFPDYLRKFSKVIYWQVGDFKDKPYQETCFAIEEIKLKIQELVNAHG